MEPLGIAPAGDGHRSIAQRVTSRSGPLPVTSRGGLNGGGHPVGAPGVRMLLDAARQVSGDAGAAQIHGARTVQTLNIGGSGTTSVSFVVGQRA